MSVNEALRKNFVVFDADGEAEEDGRHPLVLLVTRYTLTQTLKTIHNLFRCGRQAVEN